MTNLTDFFSALASRAWKENDLSDVTFAMCEGDSVFRQFFLDFFFPNAKLIGDKVSFAREHATENGRPDFWIESEDGRTFIVEVKIWDGNHHFEQYYSDLRNANSKGEIEPPNCWAHLGYIANYDLGDVLVDHDGTSTKASVLGCRLATWQEFTQCLKNYSCLNDPFVTAYLSYLKAVCPYDDFEIPDDWKVSAADFTAVARLLNRLDEVLSQDDLKDLGIKPYTRSPTHFKTKQKVGKFFEWMNRESESTVWGWIGIRYADKGAYLCVEFEDRDGWGKPICDKYRHCDIIREGVLRFYAPQNVSADKDAICEFLREVIVAVRNGNLPSATRASASVKEASLIKSLLSMKCLPVALEQLFANDADIKALSDCGYSIKLGYKSDQEVPDSHCGRYFELTPLNNEARPQQEQPPAYAWIGVLYVDGCKRKTDKVSYAERPAFVVELPSSFPRPTQMPSGWIENTWGWISYEIEDGLSWREAMPKARSVLSNYLNALKQ